MSIHVRNHDALASKVAVLRSLAGSDVLIISDFDMTLTRQVVNGQPGYSSHKVLERYSRMDPAYTPKAAALHAHYYPIEIDLSLPLEEKAPLMVQVGGVHTIGSSWSSAIASSALMSAHIL
jgi:hypothetical protein